MTRKLLLLLVALAAGAASAAAPADLSGEWYFDVASQNGPGRRDVLFRQEGSRVIGFIESDSASGRFVGSVNGAALEFTAVLEFGGQPMAAVYKATVDGDNMNGSIDFGLYGKATFTGHRGRRPQAAQAATGGSIEGSARTAGIAAASNGDFFGIMRDGVLLPEMVAIPAGHFRMGNDGPAVKKEYGDDFARVHAVEVSAFRMSRFLVTNAQYAAFASATKREPLLPPKGWSDYTTRYPNHPVVSVNYDDATAYARWLAERTGEAWRLPTEAEWEYAARGGIDGQNFVFGDEWQVKGANTSTWHIGRLVDREGWKAWWDSAGDRLSKSQPMTTRVGSFAPNGYGLYDMVGNAWQWTQDWYQSDYYAVSPPKDPIGPATGDEKVLRGCSWYNQPDVCFVATRDRYAPGQRLFYNGFRVVAAAPTAPMQDPENVDRADSGVHVIRGALVPGRQPDGNTVVLEGKGGLIVFDTGRHVWHTQKIVDLAMAEKLPVVAIFNSHWHLHHNSGNAMLLDLWPAAAVYSSDAALTEALGSFLARGAESNRRTIAEGKADPGELEDAKTDLATVQAGARLHPTVPIEKNTTLTIAGRRLEVHFAAGASAGDIWLYDPAARLVLAGDLITLPAPFLDTACAIHWTQALDDILAQSFERVVPGHGLEMGRADVSLYRDAFNALVACAGSTTEAATCADQWTTSATPLLDGGEADGRAARAYARYYVENVLRGGAKRADCPA